MTLLLGQVVLGLALLIVGAEVMVRGASHLARSIGISSFVVGLTVVAFGTSAPELGVSLRDAYVAEGELAVGNIIGSNIANIGLILGVTALICPIAVKLGVVRREAMIMIVVTFAGMLAMLGGGIHRVAGGLLVLGLLVFTLRAYRAGRDASGEEQSELVKAAKELDEELHLQGTPPWWTSVLRVVAGLAMLYFGSDFLVGGSRGIAENLGVSEAVIGLTMVAFGTSVPELALSSVAAFRKQPDIAIGNILGSNIFNILCVLGIASLLAPDPLLVPPELWRRDIWVMLLFALLCIPVMTSQARITRLEGGLLLGLYLVYMGVIYWMNRG
ncbi:MAG: calcium/sodium antiporter [Planctomycetota bacterium]